jgi:hypothetical protein
MKTINVRARILSTAAVLFVITLLATADGGKTYASRPIHKVIYALQWSPFTTSPLEGTPKDGVCRQGEFECSNRQNCVKDGDKCMSCPEGYSYQAGVGCWKCPEKTSLKQKNGSWICE